MIIAGIGSRETPPDILALMTQIGAWAKKNQFLIYSGHADGADWAFEQGAQDFCGVFLPWNTFNKHLVSQATKYVLPPDEESIAITRKFHPAFDKLSEAALKMMCRNAHQVLGIYLNNPVDVVICWTKDGKATGGTGQALRIAEYYKIPIVNLYYPEKVVEIKKIIEEDIWQNEEEKQKI